jgi:hypothetical protein
MLAGFGGLDVQAVYKDGFSSPLSLLQGLLVQLKA